MKFTLHKALRIRSAIEQKLSSFSFGNTVKLDVDSAKVRENAFVVVGAAKADLDEKIATYTRLSKAFTALKASIARANAETGVDANLAEQAHIDRQLKVLKGLLNGEALDAETLKNKVERVLENLKTAQQQATSRFGSAPGETLAVSVLSAADRKEVELKIAALRREKEGLEEERAKLNHRNEIEIGEEDHEMLVELLIV